MYASNAGNRGQKHRFLCLRQGRPGCNVWKVTVWAEIPAMLARTPDEELVRMKAVCKAHYRKFERGPEQERLDAQKMFELIKDELRRRLVQSVRPARIQ